jgi:SAM-dependent methyltransferase
VNPVLSPGGPLLLVPCAEPGRGGGHLARCLSLLQDLRRGGRSAFLYLEDEARLSALSPLVGGCSKGESREELRAWLVPGRKEAAGIPWELIVLDRFQTPPEEYAFWSSLGPLLGIDEGGRFRDDFDFLLDLLPALPELSPPNIADPSLLPPPFKGPARPAGEKSPEAATDPEIGLPPKLRVLISFGMEDKARLGPLAAEALAPLGEEAELTLLDPSGGQYIPELRKRLAEYDLLITHFGLSAFEALRAGLAVLLVSPGKYHEKLARAAGFLSAGIGAAGIRSCSALLAPRGALNRDFVKGLRQRCAGIAGRYGLDRDPPLSLGDFIEKLRPRGNFRQGRPCPSCGLARNPEAAPGRGKAAAGGPAGTPHPVLARFPDRSYRRCPRCGIVYMCRLNEPPIEYAGEYFFEFYKKQYGKTYLEDFPNLVAMGKRRLKHISPLLVRAEGESKPRLLDVGCAYGPFLVAASESGFSPEGLEPSEEAAAYVRRELKFPLIQGHFPPEPPPGERGGSASAEPACPPQSGTFSVLSFWYVIEHFREPRLALKEAGRLLRPGGVLAFATPSFRGISGRRSPRAFLEKSPADHWSVWSPKICGPLLKRSGFRLKKIIVTGHHPERFPLGGIFLKKKEGPLYGFFLLLSRLFRLGDTFEVYAVKEKD